MDLSSTLLGTSRALALLYSCYTSYRVWRPPTSLSGNDNDSKDDQSTDQKRNGAVKKADSAGEKKKKGTPASVFRVFFWAGMLAMVGSDVAIFTYFRPSYFSERWGVFEVASLLAMGAGTKLREDSFRALGEFFTFQCVQSRPACGPNGGTSPEPLSLRSFTESRLLLLRS